MKFLRKSNHGFTLLELILSLGIIGFIVTISLGAIRLGTSAQETGQLKIDSFSTFTTNSKPTWTKNKI